MNDQPADLPAHLAKAWQHVAASWPEQMPMPSGADFTAYLGQLTVLMDAQARIADDGLIIADAKGNAVPHPAILIERQAQEQIRAWGATFTPIEVARRTPRKK